MNIMQNTQRIGRPKNCPGVIGHRERRGMFPEESLVAT
jgi:hypothetical protein